MITRKPVVSGQFYSGSRTLLKRSVEGFTKERKEKFDAIGAVSPHAGYMCSGIVAGEVLSSLKPKPTYVIIGPNHTGLGVPFGLDAERSWQTPLGEIQVDKELARTILKECEYVQSDTLCHDREHSIEVQLPFLQHLSKNFRFVPITIANAKKEIYKDIGTGIASAVKTLKRNATIIASNDMTHYEPAESAEKKDKLAIERILALDVTGLIDTVKKHDISMCGVAPTAVMMHAAIELGARKAELIRYATSGEATGDYSAVVGYAGIVFY